MKKIKFSPYLKIIIAFISIILIGSIFLVLPISAKGESLSFVDSLFMSTSAVCVTGLSVVSNIAKDLTFFGQFVILILMMIGGLGILTFSTFFFVIIGSKIGLTDRFLMRESWNLDTAKGVIKLVKNIVIAALIIQFFGSLINYFILLKTFGAVDAIWVAIFQSVSAFNNVGFDILGNSNSMIDFSGNVLLNLSTMFLIVIGGFGFVSIFDIIKNKRFSKLKISTKIVVVVTPILIVVGAILIKLSMFSEITWLQAFFQSVSSRTAGFASLDMSTINTATYILIISLMFIGGSPCSTAGGIKTTTSAVIFISIFKLTVGKKPTIFKRKISAQTIIKSFSLFTLSIIYILLATFCISLFDSALSIKEILFEVVSAFGTVGFSMGITSGLSTVSKIIIILTMFFGRLGPLTIMSSMNKNWLNDDLQSVDYVEEKIIVG